MDTLTDIPIPAATGTGRRVALTVTLTAPLHHGAGSAGNTSLLRRQDIMLPDGTRAKVPFVSGNSLRHRLRDALAWHMADTLEVPDGSLSKAAVDLLWSGGALTRTGAETDLERARRIEQLLPVLTLLGYAAGSDLAAGTVNVSHLHLVCAENAWRLPAALAGHPQAQVRAGALQGEEFATRRDVAGGPVDRLIDTAVGAPKTTQMIYDLQVVKPGAVLYGEITMQAGATTAQQAVLAAALELAAPGRDGHREIHLGAKNAVGYGRARLEADLASLPDPGEALTWWTGHLRAHRQDILDLVAELTA